MGITVDLIPLLPDETPEHAIARIYEGGTLLSVVNDTADDVPGVAMSSIDTGTAPAPAGAFDEWRAEVLRRLHALFPRWSSLEEDDRTILWSTGYRWQVEVSPIDITLRLRWSTDGSAPELTDAALLDSFTGLRTIVHWSADHGTYCELDDPADRPDEL